MQNGKINKIWELLNTVPDPEIPIISVVELGVIYSVEWNDQKYIISITPTYSGCPAIKTFQDDIKNCLRKNGINNFELQITDGRITGVNVVNPIAYRDFPNMKVQSETGYGARLRPIMSRTRPQGKVLQIVDCVGVVYSSEEVLSPEASETGCELKRPSV